MLADRVAFCFLKTEELRKSDLLHLLTDEDIHEAREYRDAERSLRVMASRALMRWCLNQFRGEGTMTVSRTALGKPFVVGGPYFSLSSTPGLTVCAVTVKHEVGVDVESTRRGIELGLNEINLRIWTDREAVAKAVGIGLELAIDGLQALGDGIYEVKATGEQWQALRPKLPGEWVASVAVPMATAWTLEGREVTKDDLR